MKRKTIPEQHLFYHNTLKLLQNYRDVNWSLEVSAQNLQSEFRAEYSGASVEYVDDLTITGDKNAAARIEGLTLSLDKSRRMMQLVDSAIALMRQKHKKGELYYWILYYGISAGTSRSWPKNQCRPPRRTCRWQRTCWKRWNIIRRAVWAWPPI